MCSCCLILQHIARGSPSQCFAKTLLHSTPAAASTQSAYLMWRKSLLIILGNMSQSIILQQDFHKQFRPHTSCVHSVSYLIFIEFNVVSFIPSSYLLRKLWLKCNNAMCKSSIVCWIENRIDYKI